MKLTIEKTPKGISLELIVKDGAKPQGLVIDEAQAKSLIGLLETALSAKVFKFSMDV